MTPKYLLEKKLEQIPDKTALIDRELCYSYAEIYELVSQKVSEIQQLKSSRATVAIVMYEPSVESVVATWACLITDTIFIPLSPNRMPTGLLSQLEIAGLDVLFISQDACKKLVTSDKQHVLPDSTFQMLENQVAAIVFTSGTAGTAKGVLIPNAGWGQMIKAWETEMSISGYSQFLNLSDFNFCGFFDDMLLSFFAGGTMHICASEERKSTMRLLAYIQEHQINFLDLSPAYIRNIIKHIEKQPDLALPKSSLLIVGSESWLVEEMARIQDLSPEVSVINSYGLTESVVDNGIFRGEELPLHTFNNSELVPVGHAFGDTEFLIVDEKGYEVESGEEGELCVSSEGLSLGYFDGKKEPFFEYEGHSFVRTGDRVVQDNNGLVRLVGRNNQLVKIHGRKVDLKLIESRIRNLDFIEDVAILQTQSGGVNVHVFVVLDKEILEEQWEKIVLMTAQKVSHVRSLPLLIYNITLLPRRSDGKVDYASLREIPHINKVGKASESSTNADFYQAFECYLGEGFDRNADLFVIGADSLMVEEIILEVESVTGITLSTELFYRERTYNRIISAIKTSSSKPNPSVLDIKSSSIIPSSIRRLSTAEISEYMHRQNEWYSSVLLTGTTGFLGIYILRELLAQQKEVQCLVRAPNEKMARDKILATWHRYLRDSCPIERIKIVLGDFSKPNLGLDLHEYNTLAKSINGIIHAGYWVNFLLDYFPLQETNVQGLNNLLEFAACVNVKPITFVSSSSASSIDPHASLDEYDGYELTKYVNELQLQNFQELGYPCAIVAPSLIGPSLDTPVFSEKDFFWSFIKTCLQIGALPDVDWTIDLVEATEVAKAICNPEVIGRKQIFAPYRGVTIRDLADIITEVTTLQTKIVSFDEWLYILKKQFQKGRGLAMKPFLSGLDEKGERFFSSSSNIIPDSTLYARPQQDTRGLLKRYLVSALEI